MNAETRTLRRILVGIDASRHSLAALEAAATLAAEVGAEIVGLFVEDADALRMASFPRAHVVEHTRHVARATDVREMQRALQAVAERARRAVETAATRAHVSWSFRVARGRVTPEILAASDAADLLFVGTAGSVPHRRRGLGSTARAAVGRASAVLVVREGERFRRPVVVLYDGSPAADHALDVAADCLPGEGHGDRALEVLVSARNATALAERARQRLEPRRVEVRTHSLGYDGPDVVVRAATSVSAGTLVLPAEGPLSIEGLETVIDAVRAPVLLVR